MEKQYIQGEKFEGINYAQNRLVKGEYENCRFVNCVFSEADLSDIVFIDCTFENCDLSLAKTRNTAFREVQITGCKLLGIHFEDCNKFLLTVSFSQCLLNLSSFYKLSLKNSKFIECKLHEVDFSEADLTNAVFSNCDLMGAVFGKTNLEKADLRNSYNFSIDPERNKIKKAKFSMNAILGLLDKYDIHVE